ncbi:MAG: hypothetical protein N5P05_003549 [Chroococcopsis gigantea SAG 12.99]|jgi:hypothetical protein|nr:hypothetical protein [Chroococcopsis gigantea SAG 12.99]
MNIPVDFSQYTQWSGILTLVCLVFTTIAFLSGWGFRFRLVGITGFMVVLTVGIFGLGLGLLNNPAVPGSVKYALVYDNGANQAVITVADTVTPDEVSATLKQAANRLFSLGRLGTGGNSNFIIRARTLIHPEPGLSTPVYLGNVQGSLQTRDVDDLHVELYEQKFALLPKS